MQATFPSVVTDGELQFDFVPYTAATCVAALRSLHSITCLRKVCLRLPNVGLASGVHCQGFPQLGWELHNAMKRAHSKGVAVSVHMNVVSEQQLSWSKLLCCSRAIQSLCIVNNRALPHEHLCFPHLRHLTVLTGLTHLMLDGRLPSRELTKVLQYLTQLHSINVCTGVRCVASPEAASLEVLSALSNLPCLSSLELSTVSVVPKEDF